jgi:hypothetical protein
VEGGGAKQTDPGGGIENPASLPKGLGDLRMTPERLGWPFCPLDSASG